MSKVTVAEKLSAIGNNMARVYDTGFEKGHDQGFEEGKQFSDYAQGFEEGKQAERDAFWDAFILPTRRNWEAAFKDAGWNDTTFYPKHDIIATGNAGALFRYCRITDLEGRLKECGVTLDTSRATSLNVGFGESTLLTTVPTIDVTKCTGANTTNGLFSGCVSLKTIRKIIVSEATVFSTSFQNCPALENITFEGEIASDITFCGSKESSSSTKLTEASIRSIIEHLSDTASGKTLTLSKVAVDNAYGWYIGDDFAPGSSSGTWDGLVVSKPNWTITLV